MSAYQIGQQLRRLVQQDHQLGRPLEPRRLQAVIGDLCGDDASDLVAPLRYLVLSSAFASAASQTPPLADGRLLPRLQNELAQMYAPPLCARLQPLLEGLLALPERAATAPSNGTEAGAWSGVATSVAPSGPARGHGRHDPAARTGADHQAGNTPTTLPPPSIPTSAGDAWDSSATDHSQPRAGAPFPGGGAPQPAQTWAAAPAPAASASPASGSRLNAALAFLSGMLVVLAAGLAFLLWQRQSGLIATPSTSTPAAPALPSPAPDRPATTAGNGTPPAPMAEQPPQAAESSGPSTSPTTGETTGETASEEAGSSTDAAGAVDRAVASIQELYGALSAKDFDQARGLFGPAAADQFEPGFFRQFERVSVQDLRRTSQSGSTVNLEGVVSFVYPDGSIQTETRSFSVDSSSTPARITASEFGRVIKPR